MAMMDTNNGGPQGYGTTENPESGLKEVGEKLMEESHVMGLVILEQGKSQMRMITDGPKGLGYLSLIGGLAMVVCSVLGILFRTGPLKIITQVYLAIFGLAILTVELKKGPFSSYEAFISEYFLFMYGLYGRAMFYVFCSTLLLAQWPFFPDFVCGCYLGFLAFVYVTAGLASSKKLTHELTEDQLEEKFKEHDTDQDGRLSTEEFTALCQDLDIEMNLKQIEAAMLMIDSTHVGTINKEDFMRHFTK
uniref:EF-hand domain-containing protein n=1 Tax=Octactis speculum TaxID=3111310 RepID=A0A7S2ARP6_9STRA|mmetsp:Transcript_14593/g.19460  ORF Transcript_14593/g.19460 Transcript_14593/m.19460 type:complete len:248 (+) Transcript_14593:53-796(+)|eukprot:CAMPEP_0185794632 /NCGR_PEP_ID=MMETSP1174-20130828/160118_1 /TAXON_ID=35687 /ORGANISM="Dictyocha speculum, Strain CCMP1381" /LENGTH=247 /DNA_ID=CAMNT_0028489871 /DNA_START=53 /DNA_END=796 /DNA_ORIENTATION=-